MENYQTLWDNVKNDLEQTYDEKTFNDVFSDINNVYKFYNGYIYMLVDLEFRKNRINRLYINKINDCLSKYTSDNIKFKFVVKDDLLTAIPYEESKTIEPEKNLDIKYRTGNLNTTYSFDNFVVGKSNNFAFRMAMKVADQPGDTANPLYIFGDVGLGKTHLMQAIGNYIMDIDINKKVLYVKADQFIEDFTSLLRKDQMDDFYKKYRELDVLLIDDIQILGTAKKSQIEFFKIFDILFQGNKQIVITSDRPANELTDIMSRLTSRFEMGLTVDIQVPDLNHRINILKKKLAVETPNEDTFPENVLDFIASSFKTNIRELEGALKRVLFYCITNDIEITIEHSKEALDALLKTKKITDSLNENNFDKVLSIVADYYSVTINDIIGKNRSVKYTLPRHISMYLIKKTYEIPYKKIGSLFGNRDHSTVLTACEKIDNEIKHDVQLKTVIETIQSKIQKL